MADVFISYSRQDEQVVERLVRALEAHQIAVWWDRSLEQNADFGSLIDEQIDAAKAIVVCWSEASTRSRWVRGEASRGEHQGKYLGVLIGDALLPTPFNTLNNTNLKAWNGAADDFRLLGFLDALAAKLERPELRGLVEALRRQSDEHAARQRAQEEAERVRRAREEQAGREREEAAEKENRRRIRLEQTAALRRVAIGAGAIVVAICLAVAWSFLSPRWHSLFPRASVTADGRTLGIRATLVSTATLDHRTTTHRGPYCDPRESGDIALTPDSRYLIRVTDDFVGGGRVPQRVERWSVSNLRDVASAPLPERSLRLGSHPDQGPYLYRGGLLGVSEYYSLDFQNLEITRDAFGIRRSEDDTIPTATPVRSEPSTLNLSAYAASTDGRYVVRAYGSKSCFFSSCSSVGYLEVYDGRTGASLRRSVDVGYIGGLQFTEDSRHVVSWDEDVRVDSDSNFGARLWNVENLESSIVSNGAVALVSVKEVNGTELLFVQEERSVSVWLARDGRRLAELHGHSGRNRMAISNDGMMVVTMGSDCRLRTWRLSLQ